MAFKEVSAHLRGPDDYELITYDLMRRLKEETVLHAEVYVAVGVCLYRKQDFAAIFEGLERGRVRGAREFGVSLLWIFDATRHFGVESAQQVFEVAARYRDRHVVGIRNWRRRTGRRRRNSSAASINMPRTTACG